MVAVSVPTELKINHNLSCKLLLHVKKSTCLVLIARVTVLLFHIFFKSIHWKIT